MRKTGHFVCFFFLSIFAIPTLLSGSVVEHTSHFEDPAIFQSKIIGLVKESILYSDPLQKKNKILSIVEQLEQHTFFTEAGDDSLRDVFVPIQAAFEHILTCSKAMGDLTCLVGIIHTPLPTTPLCKLVKKRFFSEIDETVRWDLDKLLTIKPRAETIRQYLRKGGRLYVAYPQGGFQRRPLDEQGRYKEALAEFKDFLFDVTLRPTELEPEMIGATYLFKNRRGQLFVFSIKARQQGDIQESAEWGVWFGSIDSPEIVKRTDEIFSYLKGIDGPDLREKRYLETESLTPSASP